MPRRVTPLPFDDSTFDQFMYRCDLPYLQELPANNFLQVASLIGRD